MTSIHGKSVVVRQWEVWFVELRAGVKRELTGKHNVIVISSDFALSQRGVALVVPITTTNHPGMWSVAIGPADAGIREESFVEADQAQSVAVTSQRFLERRGTLSPRRRGDVLAALRAVVTDLDV